MQSQHPHQLIPGPPSYSSPTEVLIAYINHLESRCNVIERNSRDNLPMMETVGEAPQITPADKLLSEVRTKNSELEVKVQQLKAAVESQALIVDSYAERNKALFEENRRLREQNSELLSKPTKLGAYVLKVGHWVRDTVGDQVYYSQTERALRLIEEAIETGQAIGVQPSEIMRIVDFVFAKPVGELRQELGGVMVCWAALVGSNSYDPEQIMNDALDYCWANQERIKEKFKLKQAAAITARPFRGPDDDAAHTTMRKPYGSTPQTNDERGHSIIAEGREALKRHEEATRRGE